MIIIVMMHLACTTTTVVGVSSNSSLAPVSVKACGAAGDGKTDDSDAFAKAFAVAERSGAAVGVDVPGTYLVSNVSMPPGATLVGMVATSGPTSVGAPAGAPVIMMPTSAAYAIQLNSSTTVRGIRFQGSPNDTHSSLTFGLVHSPSVTDVVVEQCTFADTGRGAIVTDHTIGFAFLYNLIENVAEGMDIMFSHNGVVSGNRLQNIANHGIQFWGNFNWTLQDSSNLSFTHNTVRNATGGADIWGTGAVGVLFADNDVDGAGDVALDCEWCVDAVFRNNVVRNGRNAGISLFFSCKNVVITNNTIWMWEDDTDASGLGYGIWLTGTSTNVSQGGFAGDKGHRNVTISDNVIWALGDRPTPAKYGKGTSKHAIAVQSGTLVGIRGNTLHNNTDVMLDVDMH
jgi:hypothetical protein